MFLKNNNKNKNLNPHNKKGMFRHDKKVQKGNHNVAMPWKSNALVNKPILPTQTQNHNSL